MKPKPFTTMIVVLGLLLGSLGAVLSPSQTSLAAPAGTIRYVKPAGLTSGDCASWGSACKLQYALSVASYGDEIWVQEGVYVPTDGIPYGSCQEIHDAVPDAADGDYVIQHQGDAFLVYCFDMAGAPAEYLTLADPASNFAQYAAGGYSPGTNVRTEYSRVRLLPGTLQIDISDQRYASSTGSLNHGGTVVQSMPYGVAIDCLAPFSQQGVARIDLRGTPFMVTDDFVKCGWNPGGGSTFSAGNQVVDLTGGGDCGVVEPASPSCMETPYNDAGGPQPILELGYLGPERRATFQLKSGVAIYGGFAGGETSRGERDWVANEAILSGDIGVAGDNSDNSYHVVTGSGVDASAVLDGFTITGGNADGPQFYVYGGGMYNDGGSPTLTNVTFTGNTAYDIGGGMFNDVNSSPVLTNVTFSDNSAAYGGGMSNINFSSPVLSNVTFTGNSADHQGGGMWGVDSSPTLTDCTFTYNTATGYGGGIYNHYGTLTINRCMLASNRTTGGGGGISNWDGALTINSSTFYDNEAYLGGGGVYNGEGTVVVNNSTFSGNRASEGAFDNYGGGGICNQMESGSAELTINNSTVAFNSARWGGGLGNFDGTVNVKNTILAGNTVHATGAGPQCYGMHSGAITTSYNLESGTDCGFTGAGDLQNADADLGPLQDNGGLTWTHALGADSQAINAGSCTDIAGVPVTVDQRGVPRIGPCDIGAYEYVLRVYLPQVIRNSP